MTTPAKITADFEYSDVELLAIVREAIATVTKFNQAYTIRGREYHRADLPELVALEQRLAERVARKSQGLAQNLIRFKNRP